MALPQKNKNVQDQKVQDAVLGSWVDTIAPIWARPYLRLSRFDRPVGAWLLFVPCVFGASFAGVIANASLVHFLHLIIVCMIGAWLMRGAGCTWNDIVDRKIDAQVERTRSRPIPSGAVSVYRAAIWLSMQAVIALMALATLEPRTIFTAIASLAIVAIYPFAKRFTNWPQIVLGLAFNWGIWIAYIELAGHITLGAIALYSALILWTLFYDTIYAFQDIRDDEVIGVKSTARVLQKHPKRYLSIFALASVALIIFAIAWDISGAGLITSIIFLAGAIGFLAGLAWQIQKFNAQNPKQCLIQFRQNVQIGQVTAIFWTIGFLSVMFR